MSKATNLTSTVRNITRKITEAKKPNFKALVTSMVDEIIQPLQDCGVQLRKYDGVNFYQGNKNVAVLSFWHDRIEPDKGYTNVSALEKEIYDTFAFRWNLQGNDEPDYPNGRESSLQMTTSRGNPVTINIVRSSGQGFCALNITVKIEGESLSSPTSFDYLPDIVPGTIYVNSFGYDMTLVNYYQVVRRSNKTIYLQEINSKVLTGGGYSGKVEPIKDSFKDDKIIRSVLSGNGEWIRLGQNGRARLWDGKPDYYNTMD